jgi:ABC-type sugar transport system substrate-binding protein
MSKRILGFVLVLAIALALLTGCASAPAPAASSPAAQSAAAASNASGNSGKTYNVVFIVADMANESQAYASKMYTKHAAEYGLNVTIMDAKGDPTVESQLVNTCIAQKSAAVFVNPNDINGIVPSLMAAKKAGLVVGLFSSDLTKENQQYRDFYVGANDLEAGKTAGQAFLKQFPDGADIVEIGGQAGHDAQIKRHDGFSQTIQGSKINVLDCQNCKTWSTSDAMNIMQDFSVKYSSKIKGVFCHWDNGLTGVIQAMKAANMSTDIYSVAIDGCRAGFDQVKAGTQTVCLMQNFETMAKLEMELARKVLDGQKVEPVNYVKWDLITKDTINNFPYPEW